MLGRRSDLPRPFWVVFVGTLVNRAGTFVEPFLILYLTTQRGFTPASAGAVLAVYGVGGLFSQLVGGWLADRVGRRVTLAGSMLASAASLILLGSATTGPALAGGALLVGFFGDMYRPASQALVADVVPREKRSLAFGYIFWAVNLGFSVAGLAAGFLAERGYWQLFVLDAATCVGFAVVVLVGIRHDPPRAVHDQDAEGPEPGFGTALRDRTFMLLLLAWCAQAVAYFQSFLTLPLAVTDAGLPTSAYGVVAAANGIVIVLVQPFAVRITARLDPSRTIAVSLALTALGFWLLTFAGTLPAFLACTVVWTLGEIGVSGHASAIVSDLADPTARGRYMGLFGTSFGVASLVAPLVGPRVYQDLGQAWLWAGCALLFLFAAGVNLGIRRTVIARRAAHELAGTASAA
ncbi:MAG: MFS transporter [Candidatus Nanopelagicales bacterium]